MDPALQLQPGQEELTPEQEAEARRFAAERIQAQLSAEPADEQAVEAWLRQAYAVAGLAPPQAIHWLNGPNHLCKVLSYPYPGDPVRASVEASIRASGRASIWDQIKASFRAGIKDHFKDSVRSRVWASLEANVRDRVRASAWDRVGARVWYGWSSGADVWDVINAYKQASWLALPHFFAVYLAPNEFQALARFNELVSAYWLGTTCALIVRRPRVLSLDAAGRLHNARGPCLGYRDGWGCYAWHGVQVLEKVILAPERLSREDFVKEGDVEVRRVMQERMGEQFLTKVGGDLIDSGPREALSAAAPPSGPKRVARAVAGQEAFTARQYPVRVPPTIRAAIDPARRLHPGQQRLTPEQEAEARRFAEERIRARLSTEPVDEQQAEAWLRQAYWVAGHPPLRRIYWLDGPHHLAEVFAPLNRADHVRGNIRAIIRGRIAYYLDWVSDRVRATIMDRVGQSILDSIRANVSDHVRASFSDDRWASVGRSMGDGIRDRVRASGASVRPGLRARLWNSVEISVRSGFRQSVAAYGDAPRLAFYHFFDTYLAPNDVHALAHFNELVSGYWLGQGVAVILRRPTLLVCDANGRLHSETGRCLEYQDGWGCYAWHGVHTPEKVILAPERLSREDFVGAWNIEVRRVIQERMGEQFMTKVGGVVIDSGPCGTLYEVVTPPPAYSDGRWERVARYVQVQDASTPRQYFLRMPPTIQTAAEAVAWTFQVGVEDYHPAQET